MRLTTAGKVAVLIVVIGVAVGAWRLWRGPAAEMMAKIAPEAKTHQAAVPEKADLPSETVASPSTRLSVVCAAAICPS